MAVPRVLTIAGSDPTGGAGIQQDLKTLHALGAWGMSAITAVTVQDSRRVSGWMPVPADVIAAQIRACVGDIGVDAVKTGMLADDETIEAVAKELRAIGGVPVVVDPVMIATTGDALIRDDAVAALLDHILPQASVVTPNATEAERLTGVHVDGVDAQVAAAEALRSFGARAVLVTGGHVPGSEVVDVLVDESGVERFHGPRVATADTHGSGCMLSAALAAWLARGAPLRSAVGEARAFVQAGIRSSLRLGEGAGPVNPWGPDRPGA